MGNEVSQEAAAGGQEGVQNLANSNSNSGPRPGKCFGSARCAANSHPLSTCSDALLFFLPAQGPFPPPYAGRGGKTAYICVRQNKRLVLIISLSSIIIL